MHLILQRINIVFTYFEFEYSKLIIFETFLQKYSLFLYNADKSGKVRATALDAFCSLLEKYSSCVSVQNINIDQLIEGICIEVRSTKGSTGEGAETFLIPICTTE